MAKRSRRRERRAAELAARKRGDQPTTKTPTGKTGPRPGSAAPRTPSGGGGAATGLLARFDFRKGMIAGAAALAIAGALILTLGGGNSDAAGIVDLPGYLNPGDDSVSVREGALAPDFELANRDDSRARLSDWRGHPVLLNFWASWCGPCRTEMPAIVALEAQFRNDGLKVLAVNIEESDRSADGFIAEFAIPFDVPMDRGGDVTGRYIRTGPPHTFFIDPDGVIRQASLGGASGADFQNEVIRIMRTLETPIGGQLAPGLKAVPTALVPDDASVAGTAGNVAPDFALAASARPSDRLRLTDLRGQAVLLAFEPPECEDCAAATADALAAAQAAGVTALVVSGLPDRRSDGILLDWHAGVAAAFGAARNQRFVVIDAAGVVHSRHDPSDNLSDDLASVLSALTDTPA